VPTSGPSTILPTQATVIINYNSDGSSSTSTTESIITKVLTPVFTFLIATVLVFFVRTKIAFNILKNWGHQYVFLYNNVTEDLLQNEIGLFLSSTDQVIVCFQGKQYELPVDVTHHGISRKTYSLIFKELKEHNHAQLSPLDMVQIPDYLLTCKALRKKTICCYFEGFIELGYWKGLMYGYALQFFDDSYTKLVRHQDDNTIIISLNPIRSNEKEAEEVGD
jgi:hypothetical protein